MKPIRRIVVPVDYSKGGQEVLGFAADLARGLKASLIVLHIWECEPNLPKSLMVQTPTGERRRLSSYVEEQAHSGMQSFLSQAKVLEGLDVESRVARGDAGTAIVQEAKRVRADLIVMGTRGTKGVERWILGSVAEKVLRRSPVPVLTVPVERDSGKSG
ncbi:MAG TPA: universal stress protein [Polyangiaceae bacterium]